MASSTSRPASAAASAASCTRSHPINFCTGRLRPARSRLRLRRPSAEPVAAAKIEKRPQNMWRYRELLPLDGEPTVGPQVGGTPLVRADRLADALGRRAAVDQERRGQLPDAVVQGPRRLGGAVARPASSGCRRSGCASTGNLANSVAANAATAGLETLHPRPGRPGAGEDPRHRRLRGEGDRASTGTYDEVNRLCTQIALKYGWGFVNVNLRPFYAEGSKTLGFEIAEDLGWRFPQHVVCPMAGGA